MSRARHHRAEVAVRKNWLRADLQLKTYAAVAAAALGASCILAVSSSDGESSVGGAIETAAQPTSSSLPPASPAEGHSPQLEQQLAGPITGTGIAQPGSATRAAAPVLQASAGAASTMLNGIDVASFQHPNGAAINWTDVAAGNKFAAIKATEGTHVTSGGLNGYYTNPYYVADAQAATAAGMYVSAYHFANPFNSGGAAQADLAAQYAGEAQNAADYHVGGKYLPIMLDLEYNPYSPADGGNSCYGLTPAQMVTWVSDFMTEATTLTGAAPIIYTPTNWWNLCTGNSTAFGNDRLWIPGYSAGTPGPLPAGWNSWSFWQYTSTGTVSGISGNVDLDYFSGAPDQETVVNTPASLQIETLNALAGQTVTYSATGLPPGLTMSSGGLITGTPTAAGAYSVTVTPASSSAVLPATVSFTWTVASSPAITSASQTTFNAGVAGSFPVTASGFPAPTVSETGALPAGVTFSNGVVSGTPAGDSAGAYPIQFTATNFAGSISQAFTLTVDATSSFVAMSPVRVLDTRNGTGGSSAPVGPGTTISLQVTGVGGVPKTGVSAVVLNVTATSPTATSYVTVYPDGEARPTASNLNFTAGETIPNLVTVPVGSDGMVDFYNNAGSVNLVADLAGYYTTASGTGSLFVAAGPSRVLDTRNGTGAPQAPVGPGGKISLQVTGVAAVPATGVTAVVLNVTATDTTATSYVTVYPDGQAQPTASNLNFTPGETIPNLVVVPVGADGKVDFYNHTGSTDLAADLAGYYTSSGTGSSFVAVSPSRLLDTRNGTGGSSSPVGANGTIALKVAGSAGLPTSGVTAVVLNVTATNTTASSYVTVYPDGQARPTASNLNFIPGETIPNLVVVPVGADGEIDFYNHTGSTDLVADLAGYYTGS